VYGENFRTGCVNVGWSDLRSRFALAMSAATSAEVDIVFNRPRSGRALGLLRPPPKQPLQQG
jgi:hypothetical protein